jgi:alcohol-forming fatty acyl-CoA reductase
MHASTPGGRTYLLTGVTGFLGKVVLAELLRRREELQVDRVYVIIRPRGARSVEERFDREVAASECFAEMPAGWTDKVRVVNAVLDVPGLELNDVIREKLAARVTHVIHSAASIDFNLPLAEAAQSNVTTALNVLDVVRGFQQLQTVVYVSTAYTTPHPGDTVRIAPVLAPLPAPADEIYRSITEGRASQAALLEKTGHPNTYTLTKSLAEHLLVANRGSVPLSIVRPSIISASWQHPFPGWIDSMAGLGAFVVMVGLGHMRAVIADPRTRIDIIPVDEVASAIFEACEAGVPEGGSTPIHHAVAGLDRSPRIIEIWERIRDFFSTHRVHLRPEVHYLGPPGMRFALADAMHHKLPVNAAKLGSKRARRSGSQLLSRVARLNTVFPYFTQHSFDFQKTRELDSEYDHRRYLATICRGVYRFLLRRDDAQWLLDGRRHPGHGVDFKWVRQQPQGSPIIRSGAWIVTKLLRRCYESITVDLHSFEPAQRAVAAGARVVIVPTHRSYFDFVLCSYLFFARPDLGIQIPYIAAAAEFGRIPILGRILHSLHAFYVARGPRKENKELVRRVAALVNDDKTLEFFVEGMRSRSREFLPPKRGLLRCLQDTGGTYVLLPVAITYDRVAEEASFARELAGLPKPEMQLSALLKWAARAYRGEIDLGRCHLACGQPIALTPASNLRDVSNEIITRLREATVTTTYHLRCFLQQHPIDGVDVDWLRDAIETRGGRVLDSTLQLPENLDATIATGMKHQFAHLFEKDEPTDAPTQRLLEVLFPDRPGRVLELAQVGESAS